MSYIIAMAGKGGTGKTTIAALLVRIIKEKKLGSVLAIDADPNSNLAEVLGVEVTETVGSILDGICVDPAKVPSGMSKDRFIEYRIQTAIAEGEGFDVLTMGRPEGPGCYCYVNSVLRDIVGKLIKEYNYTVIDNEAGLEHLSRRTTRRADALIVVSDATVVGLKAAQRIRALVKELKIDTKKNLLIIDRYQKDIEQDKIKNLGLDYLGFVPEDKEITVLSLNGVSIMKLSEDAAGLKALYSIGDKIWQSNC